MAQWDHIGTVAANPTSISFSMLNFKKPAFLEPHNKIISKTIPPMAQWKRV